MSETPASAPTWLDLYDYRKRVAQMYRERERALHGGEDEAAVSERFRAAKDALFAEHPQSPLSTAARRGFKGLSYFPYDPTLRIEAVLTPETGDDAPRLPASGPHSILFRRAARAGFTLENAWLELCIYWIDVYRGGLFLPFRDATNGTESYGGGRYLFDTVKGSDFVQTPNGIVLDFNYAYNPSCAYDARWACPLAPPENRLLLPIRAGERRFAEGEAPAVQG